MKSRGARSESYNPQYVIQLRIRHSERSEGSLFILKIGFLEPRNAQNVLDTHLCLLYIL